jgi:hypothetical protein
VCARLDERLFVLGVESSIDHVGELDGLEPRTRLDVEGPPLLFEPRTRDEAEDSDPWRGVETEERRARVAVRPEVGHGPESVEKAKLAPGIHDDEGVRALRLRAIADVHRSEADEAAVVVDVRHRQVGRRRLPEPLAIDDHRAEALAALVFLVKIAGDS